MKCKSPMVPQVEFVHVKNIVGMNQEKIFVGSDNALYKFDEWIHLSKTFCIYLLRWIPWIKW